VHFHWQNLNDGPRKKFQIHGRAWLGRMGVEWCLPSGRLSFGWSRDSERVSVHLCCLLFGLYLSFSRWKNCPDREIRLAYYGGAIWYSIWANPNEWNSKDPWWKSTHAIHLDDILLGRQRHTKETIETRDVLIPMPEGSYLASVEIVTAKWKRPRWFAHVKTCADVKIPKGIPFEGKGENSWDCGEDATYGMWTPAESVEDAIGKVVVSVLKDRKRYGIPSRIQAVAAV
jgi:hypothetical protein